MSRGRAEYRTVTPAVTLAVVVCLGITAETAMGFVPTMFAAGTNERGRLVDVPIRKAPVVDPCRVGQQATVHPIHTAAEACPRSRGSGSGSSSSAAYLHTEAQDLLRQARMLRAEAAQAKRSIEDDRRQRKLQRDLATDELIEAYFFGVDGYTDACTPDEALLCRLRRQRLGVMTLLAIVDRIFEREHSAAAGASLEVPSSECQCSEIDYDADENRLDGCIEALIEAQEVLDDERSQEQRHTERPHHRCAERASERLFVRHQQLLRSFHKPGAGQIVSSDSYLSGADSHAVNASGAEATPTIVPRTWL